MLFRTLRQALCAARRFHSLHGDKGYTYRAELDHLKPHLFVVKVYSPRGSFLTVI